MAQQESDSPVLRFLGGVVLGVIMTFAYVRYAWAMPDVAKIPGKITEAAIVSTAEIDLFNPNSSDDVRRRALSVVMSQTPDRFVEIDRQLGDPLLEEVLRREAVRKSRRLKHRMSAFDMALDKPALRMAMERKHGRVEDDEELKRRMLLSAIDDDDFVSWYLRTRFPNLNPDARINLVLNVYENELRSDSRVAEARQSTRR